MKTVARVLQLLALMLLSCSSSGGGSSSSGDAGNNGFTITSSSYTLQPDDEKFYCYAQTLTEDIVVNGFAPTYGKAIHHVFLAQTLAPEPNGFSECNVLFKTTWVPIFLGGVDTNGFDLP